MCSMCPSQFHCKMMCNLYWISHGALISTDELDLFSMTKVPQGPAQGVVSEVP